MGIVTVEKLENADKDADALEKFVEGGRTEVVKTRKNKQYPTLENAVYQVIETGGFEPFATEVELLASTPTLDKKAAKALDTKKVWLWDSTQWNDTGLSELDLAIAHSDAELAKTNTVLGGIKEDVSQKADVLFDFHTKELEKEKTIWSGVDAEGNVLLSIDSSGNLVQKFLYDFHTKVEKSSYMLVDLNFNILNTSAPEKNDENTDSVDFSKLQVSAIYPKDIGESEIYRDFNTVKVQNSFTDAIYHASIWSLLPNHLSVYALYDDLVARSTKMASTVIGGDSLGNEIKAYTYTPKALQYGSNTPDISWGKQLTSPPKILITTGVHGNEKDAILQLYLIIKQIIEDTFVDEDIALIAQSQLVIIPVCNPSGVDASTRLNVNSIDLNRNSPTDWSKSDANAGLEPLSEPESIIAASLPETFPDCDYYIDFHNFQIANNRLAWFATAHEETLPLIRKISLHINTVFRRDNLFPSSWTVRLSINDGGTFARHWQLGLGKQGFLLETPREEVISNVNPYSIYKVRQHGINTIKHALSEIINFKMLNPTV